MRRNLSAHRHSGTRVDFRTKLRTWEGFGVLSKADWQKVLDVVFGEDGKLRVRPAYRYYKQVSRRWARKR